MDSRRCKLPVLALMSALLLGACSLPPADSRNDSQGLFPYHDRDNCGMSWKYDLAPIRAVTLTPGATALLQALGVQQHVVAQDLGPDFNKIRATNADFVYSGTMAGMTGQAPRTDPVAGGLPLREALTRHDHPTHISLLYCPGRPKSLETAYLEATVIGDVFGVPDTAAQLVATWREGFKQLVSQTHGAVKPNVAIVDARGGTPKLAGVDSFAQALLAAAGGANIAVGSAEWADTDWAKVKAAKPDIVVLIAGSKPPADPALAKKVHRLDGLDDGFFEVSPTMLQLAEALAKVCHPDKF